MDVRKMLSLLCLASLLAASRTAPSPSPSPQAPLPNASGDAVTQHSVTIDGKAYAYSARAGVITLTNAHDQPAASVFYTAYTVEGASRPVTFVYNGGPGSSTMWLRMGSFGPVRVQAANAQPTGPAPYRIADNPHSLLDKSDLVFIDMPDSGFGRIAAGHEKEFFGIDQDAAAFGQFIQRYLTQFHRWNSPKFLFGESYGTTRSGVLSKWLFDHGIALNGIVLLSSILNFGLDYGNGEPNANGDWPYVLYLPTEAATAWYHNKVRNKPASLSAYLDEVERFAMGAYLDALYQGNHLSARDRNAIAGRLAAYLGIPQTYVLQSNLRIPYDRYQRELLRGQDVVFGRLDSRYTTYALHPSSNEGPPWDPTDSSIDAPYTTAINAYLRDDLKYETPLQYRANIYDIIYAHGQEGWDFVHDRHTPANVAPDLAEVMSQNPAMKVFSANGYYDFATPFFATVYTLRHLEIAAPLQQNISFGFYESGHMVYLNESALGQFKSDLSRWYDSATRR
ncbi:MAG: S10 family peptidase [Candidatus Baltobacteraceae bacterium]